jgi:hypothetical protein
MKTSELIGKTWDSVIHDERLLESACDAGQRIAYYIVKDEPTRYISVRWNAAGYVYEVTEFRFVAHYV